jgi:hypothetical protein
MSLGHRLKRLARARPTGNVLSLVCVDEEGRVLDDGSAMIRAWIGKHYSDMPGAAKVSVGVDLLVLLGLRGENRRSGWPEQLLANTSPPAVSWCL